MTEDPAVIEWLDDAREDLVEFVAAFRDTSPFSSGRLKIDRYTIGGSEDGT